MAKKKKKKQKVKSRFLDVMNGGIGVNSGEKRVGIAEAMTEFGDPIMDFLARLTNGPQGPNMDILNNTMGLIQLIWNGAADSYDMSVLDKLKASGRIGEMYDWDKLLPAMYERHKQMFPSFHDPKEKGQPTTVMNLDVEALDMYEFLSTAIMEKIPGDDEVTYNEDETYDIENILGELKQKVEETPNDVGLRLEYGRTLSAEQHFGDALDQLTQGYKLVPESGDKQLEKMLTSEILDCLDLLGMELSDFPWRNRPELMSSTEFEQKMFVYVTQNGGRVDLVSAMAKVLGSKFIEPGGDCFAQVLKGERMGLAHDTNGASVIELV